MCVCVAYDLGHAGYDEMVLQIGRGEHTPGGVGLKEEVDPKTGFASFIGVSIQLVPCWIWSDCD